MKSINLLIQSGESPSSLGYVKVTDVVIGDTVVNLSSKNQDSLANLGALELKQRINELHGDVKKYRYDCNELIVKKNNYKADHERMVGLKLSFWKRLVFLFRGV